LIQEVIKAWKDLRQECPRVPDIESLSPKRRGHILKRLRDPTFDLHELMAAIRALPFYTGDNPRGWCVDFDWVFGSDNNFRKLLEKYHASTASIPYDNGSNYDEHGKLIRG
jgi:hypothetical protein